MKFSGKAFDVLKTKKGWYFCFGTKFHSVAVSQTKDFSSGYMLQGGGIDPVEDGYFNGNFETDYESIELDEGHILFRKPVAK